VSKDYNSEKRITVQSSENEFRPEDRPIEVAYSVATKAIIDGLPISLDPPEAVLSQIEDGITGRVDGGYISITNTESMYHGLRLPAHGNYIRQANLSLCDGVGVILAGWAWGYQVRRFNGPVLQLECCRYGLPRGWRHFFYGGKDGAAEKMAARLQAQFPGLIVCGTYEPPFRKLSDEERAVVIEEINQCRPDIVWVGLGLLKQEHWIAENRGCVEAPWMIGVGAAFDYHAGTVPWAPPILRNLGLEWLFRLILQPKLRAKRYWWSLVFVLQSMAKGLVVKRLLHAGPTAGTWP
jgi:N-acetylglucosaminyldiphosphoundecaprenol N-acetyl-beta-D-mannosaminyltransferase